jgi:hypothetical protein
LATVTAGAVGIATGADDPLPAALVQPFAVCVTVYAAAFVTVIEVAVALLLHNIDPVILPAVNTELPQLLTTVTVGAVGIATGADDPLPVGLVQPFTVCVTVYAAVFVTVIEVVVALLLHNNGPVKLPAVNTELPQLLTTDTAGAVGTAKGADDPLPVALIHPFSVCVTVYAAAFVTVMDVVVALLLHNNDPVKLPAVNTELPQLLTTDTVGAAGIAFTVNIAALEFTEPALFVHTARYLLVLSAIVVLNVKVLLTEPLIFVHTVPPFVLTCHCTIGAGAPLAAEVNVTLLPAQIACVAGCVVTAGALTGAAQLIEISFNCEVYFVSEVAKSALY